jgi:SRSO17 transposase
VFFNRRTQPVQQIAAKIPCEGYRRVSWREGTKGRLSSRFAFRRVRVSNADDQRHAAGAEQWLVIEWRDGEERPKHFSLTTLPRSWSHKRIVRKLKERYRTEDLYEDLKGELGLDHYEGRSWPGWHHHVSVTLCCYAMLVAERCVAFPPGTPRATRTRPLARAA